MENDRVRDDEGCTRDFDHVGPDPDSPTGKRHASRRQGILWRMRDPHPFQ